MKKTYKILPKFLFYFFFSFIIHSSLFITNCYAQQWLVYKTQNSDLPGNVIVKVVFDSANNKWIGTTNGLAKFDGVNWAVYDTTNSPLHSNWIRNLAIENDSIVWIAVNRKGIAKFNRTNWTIYDTLNSGIASDICNFILVENNIKWIGTNRGLVKFDDSNFTLYNTTNLGTNFNFLTCGVSENNIKWVGTEDYGVGKFDNSNWAVYNFQNSGLPSNDINGMTVDYSGNKWFATMFGGVAKFNSNLNNWTVYNTSNSGLPDNNNLSVFTQNHIKWIGTLGGGLARYNDTAWTVFDPSNSPMPDGSVTSISMDRLGNLWIGTGNGLVEYNSNGIIGIRNEDENNPTEFILKQNYPNPFNPATTIKYDLPKDGQVNLKIYDILGRLVYSINEYKKAGTYETKFDGNNFASGLYFYKIESGSFVETKKMVLIK